MNVRRRIFQPYLPIFLIPLLLMTLPITAIVSLVFAQEADQAGIELGNGYSWEPGSWNYSLNFCRMVAT